MVPNNFEKLYLDPIDELDEGLDYTWRMLCDYYDVDGELPEIQVLYFQKFRYCLMEPILPCPTRRLRSSSRIC